MPERKEDDLQCNMACPGITEEQCGASYMGSVFSTGFKPDDQAGGSGNASSFSSSFFSVQVAVYVDHKPKQV